jgi:CheY-like chemotaxis protein/HPt (histidine-containing phosphotransfer) domain-containing protein
MQRILVADDNPLSLHFFSEAIIAAGIACETAEDGSAAVALASIRIFDLLLIDARMPNLDGPQTLHAIRIGNGPSRKTPAIATTAATEASTHAALLACGFAEVIAKPIALADLRRLLERHLPNRPTGGIPSIAEQPLLDDTQAIASTGGDASIIKALRGLLAAELDALPAELDRFATNHDLAALRDRLHRLDASAGFCGTPALAAASQQLRRTLDTDIRWPGAAIAGFADACARTRSALG